MSRDLRLLVAASVYSGLKEGNRDSRIKEALDIADEIIHQNNLRPINGEAKGALPIVQQIEPGEGYRLLSSDEKVKKGDEYFDTTKSMWEAAGSWRVAGQQTPNVKYRRKI